MPTLPTRIPGVKIAREETRRRPDGSVVTALPDALPHTELLSGKSGFTSQPEYSLSRTLSRSIRCTAGDVFAVAIDVRAKRRTFGKWQAFYLSENDRRCLMVPPGVALGWQLLGAAQIEIGRSEEHIKERKFCLAWDDTQLGIVWPSEPTSIAIQRAPARCLADIPRRHLPWLRAVGQAKPSRSARPLRVRPQEVSLVREQVSSQQPAKPNVELPAAEARPLQRATARRTRFPEPGPILVIGSNGRLGRELSKALRTLGTVIEACRDADVARLHPRQYHVDVARPASLRGLIREHRPSLIVNATALTDVDHAEQNPRLAQLVNANAPAIVAEEARRIGAGVVHFCSDMVFDGTKQAAYCEHDIPRPINHYARTKWLGTQAIQAADVPHLIIRCGWLYANEGDNYLRSMLDLMTYRRSITLPSNYYGTPTPTIWVAEAVAGLLLRANDDYEDWLDNHGGLYHLSPAGFASRVEVAELVWNCCKELGFPIALKHIEAIALEQLPAIAAVPSNCRLNSSRVAEEFGIAIPTWQEHLRSQVKAMVRVEKLVKISA